MKNKQSLCSKRRSKLLKNPTASELLLKKRLTDAEINFIFQKGFIAGSNFCIADFYLPKPYKVVIEVDGEYHNTPKQQVRDSNKDYYYKQRGFKVIHIANNDVAIFDFNSFLLK